MSFAAPETFREDVFINCPFDDGYLDLFRALIFTIHACGFRARAAPELDDCGQTRISKLYSIIEASKYGIHDISRTQLDSTHRLPRFNMPLELGICLLPSIADELDLDATTASYVDFEKMLLAWLLNIQAVKN